MKHDFDSFDVIEEIMMLRLLQSVYVSSVGEFSSDQLPYRIPLMRYISVVYYYITITAVGLISEHENLSCTCVRRPSLKSKFTALHVTPIYHTPLPCGSVIALYLIRKSHHDQERLRIAFAFQPWMKLAMTQHLSSLCNRHINVRRCIQSTRKI